MWTQYQPTSNPQVVRSSRTGGARKILDLLKRQVFLFLCVRPNANAFQFSGQNNQCHLLNMVGFDGEVSFRC